jgi:hypothetical protein
MHRSLDAIFGQRAYYGLIVWLPIAAITLWLNLPTRIMNGLGFSGLPAELLGFYIITYPVFIIPTCTCAWRQGAKISDGIKILIMLHYTLAVALLCGFELYNILVAIGIPPSQAFTIGPPLAGMICIGSIYLIYRLETWWTSRFEQSSSTSTRRKHNNSKNNYEKKD